MKNILVIDDDKDILEAIEMLLSTEGYNSQSSTGGEDIYKLVNTYNPDLIILDVLLSGSDGRNICKDLKMNKNTKEIPVLMISAHPSAMQSVIDVGANNFLAKPFNTDRFLSEIKKLLIT